MRAWLCEQVALADQPRSAAHSERAATEAEEVDLVARHVVVHDEAVRITDVLRQSVPKGSTEKTVEPAVRADALVVEDDLGGAVLSRRRDRLRDLFDVRRAIPIATVPRA